MTKQEFIKEFNILCDYYKAVDLKENGNLLDKYYDYLKNIDISDWKIIRNRIDLRYKYMPKIMEIQDVYSEYRSEIAREKEKEKKTYACKLCNESGFVIVRDNKNRQYAVACDCRNGDDKIYDGRTIKDEKHRSIYVIPRYSQVVPKER